MPEALPASADPMVSVGYLVAACVITAVSLGAYTLMLRQWIKEAFARNSRLRAGAPPNNA